MITIKLDDFSAEDFKIIQELKKEGLPDELIQMSYNNTVAKRETEEVQNGRC